MTVVRGGGASIPETALVLAAQRPDDPLARRAPAGHKCLLPIQGRAMIERVEDEFGRLDALVNNAAVTHFVDLADLDGMTEAMWDEILAVNLKGAFFVSRAAVRLLKASDSATRHIQFIVVFDHGISPF